MKNNLQELFLFFKNTKYYNNSKMEIDISWLNEKLEQNEIDNLEYYIAELLLQNEQELFINTIKFVWDFYYELSLI